jgi:hypothetical protein
MEPAFCAPPRAGIGEWRSLPVTHGLLPSSYPLTPDTWHLKLLRISTPTQFSIC